MQGKPTLAHPRLGRGSSSASLQHARWRCKEEARRGRFSAPRGRCLDEIAGARAASVEFKELNKVLRREFSILEPLVEARVISTGGGAGGAAGLSRPTTTFSGARGPSQLRPKTTPFGERGLQSRSGPKRTESKRSVFERRMQKYSETNLREIMKEKDFNEVAEKRRAATSMPRSRTLPNL